MSGFPPGSDQSSKSVAHHSSFTSGFQEREKNFSNPHSAGHHHNHINVRENRQYHSAEGTVLYSGLRSIKAVPNDAGRSSTGSFMREPASGFVLISVKRLSKVPKTRTSSNMLQSSIIPGQSESSCESSVSSDESCAENAGFRTDGCSVEAEEFYDYERDDVYDVNSDPHAASFQNMNRTFSENGFCSVDNQSTGSETSKNTATFANAFSGSYSPAHLRYPNKLYHKLSVLNGHTQHIPTPHGMFSPRPPSFMLNHLQRNNSYADPQILPRLSQGATTAPVSAHISPPQINDHHSVSHLSIPTTTAELNVELVQDSSPPLVYHTPYSHARAQCLHHLYSTNHSEVRSTRLHPSTNTEQMTPLEASIAVVNLPPLQPASRFRKARIHETVEQWTHGRASVHDCRVRAIPDWVLQLTKKTQQLERDLTSAAEQRVNCLPCLEEKTFDHNHSDTQTLRAKSNEKSFPVISNMEAPPSENVYDKSDHRNALIRNNLFAFWDSGSRVHCPISNVLRIATHSGHDTHNVEPCPLYPTSQERLEHSGLQETDTKNPCAHDSATARQSSEDAAFGEVNSASFHNQPNDTDPATAYLLRHHEYETRLQQPMDPSTLSNPVKCGDNPIPHSESASTLVSHHSVCRPVSDTIGSVAHQPKPIDKVEEKVLSNPAVTGLAPPTSPTCADTTDLSQKFEVKCVSETTVINANGNITNEAQSVYPVVSRRQHAVSGNYQNVTNMEHVPLVLGDLTMPIHTSLPSALPHTCSDNTLNLPNGTSTEFPTVVLPQGKAFSANDTSQSFSNFLRSQSTHGLDIRISKTMEMIRSTIENAFQLELTGLHSENMRLSAEVDRLNSELTLLRGYQAAFYALRPFVNSDVWNQLQQQMSQAPSSSAMNTQRPTDSKPSS